MAFNPIETNYKPNFGLGAYYQGINAANAKQLTEEDILKAFLANQREEQQQPLDYLIKQWDAAHAQDKLNSPAYRDATLSGYIGQAKSMSAAGKKADETVASEIPAINQDNKNKLFMGKTLEDWNNLRLEQQVQEAQEPTTTSGSLPNIWGGELRGSPSQTSTNPSWSGPGGIQRWSDWGNNVLGNMKKESNVANAIRTREDQQPPVLSNMIKEQPQGNVLSKLQNILVNTPEQIQALDKVKAMGENQQNVADTRGQYLLKAALARLQKPGEKPLTRSQGEQRAFAIISGLEKGDIEAARIYMMESNNSALSRNPAAYNGNQLSLPATQQAGGQIQNAPSAMEQAGLLTGDSTRRNETLRNRTTSGNKFTIEKTP